MAGLTKLEHVRLLDRLLPSLLDDPYQAMISSFKSDVIFFGKGTVYR